MHPSRSLPPAVAVAVALTLSPAPAAAASPGPGCPAAQVKSASKLVKSALGCFAKWAKNPGRDPGEEKLDACLDKAADRFASAYEKALQSYSDCQLVDPVDDVIAEHFEGPFEALIDAILQFGNPANKVDAGLRSTLIKEAGGTGSKWLSAWSRWLKKPDALKLLLASLKAGDRSFAKMERAIAKCLHHGVPYFGPTPDDILEGVDEAVMDFLLAVAGVREYSLAGTSDWTGCRDPSDDGAHSFEGFAFLTGVTGGPAAGGWFALVDGSLPMAGNLQGVVAGGMLDATVNYVDDSRGTGTCSGAVADPEFDLVCGGQDTRGDTCTWTANVNLVRD
jgi:hypothetical protein